MSEAVSHPRADDLALYMSPNCLYCRRVMATIDKLGVNLEYRDIRDDPAHLRDLVEARGRRTVPVLRIASSDPAADDEWMPESADIERYLAARFGDGTVASRGLVFHLPRWQYVAIVAGVAFVLARVAGCF